MARFWTSDLHFGHANVIEYCKRPYANVTEMNEALIHNWNATVAKEDTLVFVGDWCMNPKFYWVLRYLNFAHLTIVLGNHDREKALRKQLEEYGLVDKVTVCDSVVVDIGGTQFYVTHRPMDCKDDMPGICGHVHERWKFLKAGSKIAEHSRNRPPTEKIILQPILNVGCDVHSFKPITDDQVLEFFK